MEPQTDAPALDRALAHLANVPPELGPGYSNHVPMVIETLDRLGYRDILEERAIQGREYILANPCNKGLHLQPAVFHDALAERKWQHVLAAWLPRLSAGMAGGAAHGLIRTAHAVRALERIPTPARIAELGDALTYWEAAWVALPGEPKGTSGPFSPEEAIRIIPLCNPKHLPEGSTLIVEQLQGLEQHPGFRDVINMVVTDENPNVFLDNLAHLAARILMANLERAPVAFLHALTAVNATRVLIPYLPQDIAPIFLRYLWQLVAGLYSWYAEKPPAPPLKAKAGLGDARSHLDSPSPDAASPRELAALIEVAVQAGGDHAIKATAACMEEFKRCHSPIFLQIPPALLNAGLGSV